MQRKPVRADGPMMQFGFIPAAQCFFNDHQRMHADKRAAYPYCAHSLAALECTLAAVSAASEKVMMELSEQHFVGFCFMVILQ